MSDITELEWLRGLYIEDLERKVNWTGTPRPRVRHPQKWKDLSACYKLLEGIEQPVTIPPLDPERKVWIWSDQHFFHKNIIGFSERPFVDLDEMHEHMIANHNEYVGENDIVLWNGDVGFARPAAINEILDQCNGYKVLIIGNHDFSRKKKPLDLNFDEMHLCYLIDYPEVSLFLTHYPMYNIPWPWVNIHGHLHAYPDPISKHPRHINVNCEVQEYRPILLDEVARKARVRMIADEI